MYVSSAQVRLREESNINSTNSFGTNNNSVLHFTPENNMNETSVWHFDDNNIVVVEPEQQRSSTPLYPSVAQRIVEWTSLSSEQSRLKSLSYNDSCNSNTTSPFVVQSSPEKLNHNSSPKQITQRHLSSPPPLVVSSPPHRRYSGGGSGSGNGGQRFSYSSSSSVDHSVFSSFNAGANNNNVKLNGNNFNTTPTSLRMDDHEEKNNRFYNAQSCQTEIIPSYDPRTTTTSSSNYNSHNNNNYNQKANLQMLAAELDASRDLNRKLSVQLAKTERDLQSLKIQQDLQNDKLDALVASRVSEILNRLCDTDATLNGGGGSNSGKRNSSVSSAPSPPTIDNGTNFDYVSDQEVKRLLMQLNKPNLTADEIAKNCNAMLAYVKSKGDCRVNVRNGRFVNDVHVEQVQSLTTEKISLENQLHLMSDRLQSLEYENSNLKTHNEELLRNQDIENSELREAFAELSYEYDKLKQQLAIEVAKKPPSKPAADVLKLETEKNELQRQLEREQTEKQELFLQLSTVNSRLAQVEYDDNGETERYRLEKEHLTAELAEIYGQIHEMRETNDKNAQTFNNELVKLRSDNDELLKVCDELTDNRDRVLTDLKRANGDNDKLQRDMQELLDQLQKLSRDNERLQSDLANSRNAVVLEQRQLQQEDESLRGKLEDLQSFKDKLEKENEKLKEKYERQETKWEREAYDLRRRYQEADEEKFQLQEELKLQRRDTEEEIERLKKHLLDQEKIVAQQQQIIAPSTAVVATVDESRSGDMEEKLKQLINEKKQLETKNDELKRLVTVLRRKLGALTTTT